MNWIAENWLALSFGGGMLAMHLFGHGHGHGSRKKARSRAHSPKDTSDATFEEPAASRPVLAIKPKIDLTGTIEQAEFAVAKPKV